MSLVRPVSAARRTTREGLDIPDEQSGANPFAVMASGQRSRATVALVVSGTEGGPAFATFTRDRSPGARVAGAGWTLGLHTALLSAHDRSRLAGLLLAHNLGIFLRPLRIYSGSKRRSSAQWKKGMR